MPQQPPSYKHPLSHQNRMLAYYMQHLQNQQSLLNAVRKVLPETLATQVNYCMVKDRKLLLYTTSAIWGSQLRFYDQLIRSSIEAISESPIDNLQIRLLTEPVGLIIKQPPKAILPSAATIDNLRDSGLTAKDRELQQSLLNLSSTLERLSKKCVKD